MSETEFARAFGAVEGKLQTLIDLVGRMESALDAAHDERVATDLHLAAVAGQVGTLRRDVDRLALEFGQFRAEVQADRASTSGTLATLRDWRVRLTGAAALAAGIWVFVARVDLARLGAALSDMGVGK